MHASGATQLWYAGGGGDGGGGGGIAVGARAELLTEAKKGGAKAVAAADRLRSLNRDVRCEAIVSDATAENIDALVADDEAGRLAELAA